jgi:hypothetical protein
LICIILLQVNLNDISQGNLTNNQSSFLTLFLMTFQTINLEHIDSETLHFDAKEIVCVNIAMNRVNTII